jgi:hypothetical protein
LKDQAREKLNAIHHAKEKIELTNENLNATWQLAIEFLASDKKVYKSAISESILHFNDDDITIHATIVALDFLKPERLRLLDFFKNAYHNEAINILFAEKINTNENTAPLVLSSKDVYEMMVERHPNVKRLRDFLRMELDI